MRIFPLVAFTLLGCHTTRQSVTVGSECPRKVPAAAATFSPQLHELLVGSFRLVQIDTTWPGHIGFYERREITLRVADSVARARARSESHLNHVRNIQLVGESKSPDVKFPEYAELDSSKITIGCQNCFDAAPLDLYVNAVSPNSFYGKWYQGLGIGMIVRDGHMAPDPAGYFCALRIKEND